MYVLLKVIEFIHLTCTSLVYIPTFSYIIVMNPRSRVLTSMVIDRPTSSFRPPDNLCSAHPYELRLRKKRHQLRA